MSRSRNNRRFSVRPNAAEWDQLVFICRALNVAPAAFMISLIPVHYAELMRVLRDQAAAPAPEVTT